MAVVVLLACSAQAANAAPFSATYDWTGPTTGVAGWERSAVPDSAWYESILDAGGVRVRPDNPSNRIYPDGTRDGWEFHAPSGSRILSVELAGLDARQAESQRPRLYLAPHAGDDLEAVAPWGRETVADGDALPSTLTLMPLPGEQPNQLRAYLRTRECGLPAIPACVAPSPSTAARLRFTRAVIAMDDPTPPSAVLSVSGAPVAPAWTNAASVDASVSAGDTQSGISETAIGASGGAVVNYTSARSWPADDSGASLPRFGVAHTATASVNLPLSGPVQITAASTDGAGVSTPAAPVAFNVDRIAPPAPKFTNKPKPRTDITVSDAQSGIAAVEITLDGVAQAPPACSGTTPCRFKLRGEPGQTARVVVRDRAANTSQATVVIYGRSSVQPSNPTKPGAKKPKPPNSGKAPKAPTANCTKPKSKSCPKSSSSNPGRGSKPGSARKTPTYSAQKAKRLAATKTSGGCSTNALALGAGGSFALGHVCAGDQVVWRGKKFRAPCQIQKRLDSKGRVVKAKTGGKVPQCNYEISRIQPYTPEDGAKAGSYCAIVPTEKRNRQPAPGVPGGGPVKQQVKSGSQKRNVNCNKVILDKCKESAQKGTNLALVNELKKLVAAEQQRVPSLGDPLGADQPYYSGLTRKQALAGLATSYKQLKPCDKAEAQSTRSGCEKRYPYVAAATLGSMVNPETGGASGTLLSLVYEQQEPSGLPVCLNVNPMPDDRVPSPADNPFPPREDFNSVCPIRIPWKAIDRETAGGPAPISWRFVTRDRRYVMAQVAKRVGTAANPRYESYPNVPDGLQWVYLPIEAFVGHLPPAEHDGTPSTGRLVDLCATSMTYLRSKGRSPHPFGFTNAGTFGAKAGLWGNIVACSGEKLGT